MLKEYEILEVLDEFSKIPPSGHGICYYYDKDYPICKKLYNFLKSEEHLYVFSNPISGTYDIKIGIHEKNKYKEKERFEIDFNEYKNYKRTKLIDRILK